MKHVYDRETFLHFLTPAQGGQWRIFQVGPKLWVVLSNRWGDYKHKEPISFDLMCMYVCCMCMYVWFNVYVCACCQRDQERTSDPLELEVVSCLTLSAGLELGPLEERQMCLDQWILPSALDLNVLVIHLSKLQGDAGSIGPSEGKHSTFQGCGWLFAMVFVMVKCKSSHSLCSQDVQNCNRFVGNRFQPTLAIILLEE